MIDLKYKLSDQNLRRLTTVKAMQYTGRELRIFDKDSWHKEVVGKVMAKRIALSVNNIATKLLEDES